MGNVLSNTTIKNGKGVVSAAGQTMELTDEQFESAKMNMFIFPELHFEELGYSLELEGVKDIEGEDAYKVVVSNPTGSQQINYYSVSTGLKLKTESTEAGEIIYSDYESFEGVKYPMMSVMKNPMIPFPLEAKVISLEFNLELGEDAFN